ncbi:MAG TPA: hypothetical protein VFE48_12570 [Methylomirabilota bacterium]|nr:hypothetical protein [Methylomirabilota bacterium]
MPSDVRDVQIAVESRYSIYLLSGTGDRRRLLASRRTQVGAAPHQELHDDYVAPSLSPDGSHVACIRLRNHGRYGRDVRVALPPEVIEVLIVRLADRAERLVLSTPDHGRGGAGVLGPVWSRDGRRVFFGAEGRIWVHRIGDERPESVATLPVSTRATRHYLRVVREGDRLVALLPGPSGSEDAIAEIDPATGAVTLLWSGPLSSSSTRDVDRPLPAPIAADVAEALFGSPEWPVLAPHPAPDRRVYFFERFRQGPLGRRWIAGYDRATGTEFEVRTMWHTFWWE